MTSFQSVFLNVFVFPSRVALRWIFALDFLDLFLAVYFLLSLVAFFSIQPIFTQNPLSAADEMCTSLSSAVVFWRKLMGYPSYASNCACVLPSFSPFYYVVARIVPAVQLAAHVKSSTLYGRPYGHKSNFFRLNGLLLFRIIMGLHYAYCGLRYY